MHDTTVWLTVILFTAVPSTGPHVITTDIEIQYVADVQSYIPSADTVLKQFEIRW